MWYALGHIEQPTPAPIIRTVQPASGAGVAIPRGKQPPAVQSTAPAVTKGSVFEMPPGLPPFLKKQVTVPSADASSEFGTLAYVAQQAGVPFTHKGPDYALLGTKVPFGKPVPVYEFLWYIGKSYVPGVININGSGAIAANNQKESGR